MTKPLRRKSQTKKYKPRNQTRPVKPDDITIGKPLAEILPTSRKKPGPKPKTPAERKAERDEIYAKWADRVIEGKPIQQVGPGGKTYWAAAPIAIQQKVWQSHHDKVLPDLTATAIRAQIQTEDVTEEPPSDRDLARMIGSLVYEAGIESSQVLAIETQAVETPSSAPEHEGAGVPVVDPSPRKFDPEAPIHGQRHAVGWNSAHCRWYAGENGTQGRWHVLDNLNTHHSTRCSFDAAIKHAQSLPIADGAFNPDPWEVQRNANEAIYHRPDQR